MLINIYTDIYINIDTYIYRDSYVCKSYNSRPLACKERADGSLYLSFPPPCLQGASGRQLVLIFLSVPAPLASWHSPLHGRCQSRPERGVAFNRHLCVCGLLGVV